MTLKDAQATLCAVRVNHNQMLVYKDKVLVGHITEVWDPYTGGMYRTSRGGWYVDHEDAIESFRSDPLGPEAPHVPFDGQVPF